jgi:hypothetical protein
VPHMTTMTTKTASQSESLSHFTLQILDVFYTAMSHLRTHTVRPIERSGPLYIIQNPRRTSIHEMPMRNEQPCRHFNYPVCTSNQAIHTSANRINELQPWYGHCASSPVPRLVSTLLLSWILRGVVVRLSTATVLARRRSRRRCSIAMWRRRLRMSITVRRWRLLLVTVSLRRVSRTWAIAGGVRSRIGSRGAVAGMSLIRGVAAVVEVLVRRRRRGREVSRGRITVSTLHGI